MGGWARHIPPGASDITPGRSHQSPQAFLAGECAAGFWKFSFCKLTLGIRKPQPTGPGFLMVGKAGGFLQADGAGAPPHCP